MAGGAKGDPRYRRFRGGSYPWPFQLEKPGDALGGKDRQADAKEYLIGITANLWKNQWRKEKRRQKIAPSHVLTEEDLSDSPSEYSAAVAPDLLTSCINRETSAMLRAAIHDLPEKYRVIVLMYYSVDLSTKEIAEQLHISKGTVTSRLQRSREKIKEKLEEMGYER